jgi:streptogramin lyase
MFAAQAAQTLRLICAVAVGLALWPIGADAQTVSEFPVPTLQSFPSGIAAGPDGALWFTEQVTSKIGRITTDGTVTEFTLPTGSVAPYGITAGPDNALWFADHQANKIGRITTAGVVTDFLVPTGSSSPFIVTPGPDGALWFTEWTASKIGRITTAGVITEFPIPTANSSPEGITLGPDGALWFTESCISGGCNGAIGRITTAGNIAEFAVPAASMPRVITAGPDGALWFTEWAGNKIGRITTDGAVTEFQLPVGGSLPYGITAAPDGALWFTEFSGNKVGRITTAGVITEFPIVTAGSAPVFITVGPDGALWFTEQVANKIASLPVSPMLLRVSPANIVATGPEGGPFTPTSFQYQLSAAAGSLNYAITGIPSWLNANFTSGTLTTTPTTVTFSLNNVGGLTPDVYGATIAFTNTSTGAGNTKRNAVLAVYGSLTATPSSGPAPLSVVFETWVQQGDKSIYTVDFGDGSHSPLMAMRPSGLACTGTGPCYSSVLSTPHTYASPGKYAATLRNSALAVVATAGVDASGAARPAPYAHPSPLLTYHPGTARAPQPRNPPWAQAGAVPPALAR